MSNYGLSRTRIYHIYSNMKDRCKNKNNSSYNNYGGRGITVCDEWQGENGFINFYNWSMKNGYTDNLTIDRIDNDKGYSPDNCRWVTRKEQGNNKRNNRFIEYNGETHTLAEWSEILKIPYSILIGRVNNAKWDIKRAFTDREYKMSEKNSHDKKGKAMILLDSDIFITAKKQAIDERTNLSAIIERLLREYLSEIGKK